MGSCSSSLTVHDSVSSVSPTDTSPTRLPPELERATRRLLETIDVQPSNVYWPCDDLVKLLQSSSENRRLFCTSGSLVLLVGRLETAQCPGVVDAACDVVRALATDPSCHSAIVDSGFLSKAKWFLTARTQWLQNAGVLNGVLLAVAIVCDSVPPTLRVLVEEEPPVAPALLYIVHSHGTSATIHNTWYLLWLIANHSATGARTIFPEGREDVVVASCVDAMSRVADKDIARVVISTLVVSTRSCPGVREAVRELAPVVRPLLDWHAKAPDARLQRVAFIMQDELGWGPVGEPEATLRFHEEGMMRSIVDSLRSLPETSGQRSIVLVDLDDFLRGRTVPSNVCKDTGVFEALADVGPTDERAFRLTERLLQECSNSLGPVAPIVWENGIVRRVIRRHLLRPAERGTTPNAQSGGWLEWLAKLFRAVPRALRRDGLRANDLELFRQLEIVVRWQMTAPSAHDAVAVADVVDVVFRDVPDESRQLFRDTVTYMHGVCFPESSAPDGSQYDLASASAVAARRVPVMNDDLYLLSRSLSVLRSSDVLLDPEECDVIEAFAGSVPATPTPLGTLAGRHARALLERQNELRLAT